MSWKTKPETFTTHSPDCKRVFGRLDKECPRCIELNLGATRRKGWGWLNRENELARLQAIKAHDFGPNNPKHVGGVCTCFDW